jgi:hypothetical protein
MDGNVGPALLFVRNDGKRLLLVVIKLFKNTLTDLLTYPSF